MSERYIKIYVAAILDSGLDHFDPPATEEEKQQYANNRKWIEEMRAKADEDGKAIMLDVPFDD